MVQRSIPSPIIRINRRNITHPELDKESSQDINRGHLQRIEIDMV